MNAPASNSVTSNVVVVILTYNQKDKTIECLGALLGNEDKPFRVLLWDNGSQDQTAAAVERAFPQVVIHYSPDNLGVARGRNAAAQLAMGAMRASHLLFLDNDILVEPGFVRALYQPFSADPQIGQTQAKLRFRHDRARINDGGGAQINFIFWQVKPVGVGEIDRGQYDTPRACISCGGAMLVRADLFTQFNGFDPLFGPFGPEDLDFSLRLQKGGYKAMYIPQAVGYHQVSHTYGGDYSEEYARHKSRHWLAFMRRHASPAQKAAFFLFGAPILAVRVFIREARRGNLGAVRGLVEGLLHPKKRV
jgi:hypothetical protein